MRRISTLGRTKPGWKTVFPPVSQMMSNISFKFVLLAAATALAYLAPAVNAQETIFNIPRTPALLPWSSDNQTRAYQAGSPVAELNLARIFFGPCIYRMMHLHIYADELFVVLRGQVESVLVAPNNTVYRHTLYAGDNVVYPKGWIHYQLNPNCTQAETLLAFNAKSIGTVAIPQALGVSDIGYLQAAYNVSRFPTPGAVWVRDAKCVRACRPSGH
ncbi:hypothetical protein VaNZ11_000867 [Volvox africanus]|uniref:Germin-like protein n=1 Tax=Volvox africanus TaxID=51714 RepID=A0ABQ5RN96_9CHLO|nr:hypothetical protein VaNZ11_000867 [Volvox africanus]